MDAIGPGHTRIWPHQIGMSAIGTRTAEVNRGAVRSVFEGVVYHCWPATRRTPARPVLEVEALLQRATPTTSGPLLLSVVADFIDHGRRPRPAGPCLRQLDAQGRIVEHLGAAHQLPDVDPHRLATSARQRITRAELGPCAAGAASGRARSRPHGSRPTQRHGGDEHRDGHGARAEVVEQLPDHPRRVRPPTADPATNHDVAVPLRGTWSPTKASIVG